MGHASFGDPLSALNSGSDILYCKQDQISFLLIVATFSGKKSVYNLGCGSCKGTNCDERRRFAQTAHIDGLSDHLRCLCPTCCGGKRSINLFGKADWLYQCEKCPSSSPSMVIYTLSKHDYKQQDNVRTNTESVQCHHVFDTAYVAPALRGHKTSSIA